MNALTGMNALDRARLQYAAGMFAIGGIFAAITATGYGTARLVGAPRGVAGVIGAFSPALVLMGWLAEDYYRTTGGRFREV